MNFCLNNKDATQLSTYPIIFFIIVTTVITITITIVTILSITVLVILIICKKKKFFFDFVYYFLNKRSLTPLFLYLIKRFAKYFDLTAEFVKVEEIEFKLNFFIYCKNSKQ